MGGLCPPTCHVNTAQGVGGFAQGTHSPKLCQHTPILWNLQLPSWYLRVTMDVLGECADLHI